MSIFHAEPRSDATSGIARSEQSQVPPSQSTKRSEIVLLAQAIVFSSLALVGGGLIALLALTSVDWVLPTMVYLTVVYLAWQRFF